MIWNWFLRDEETIDGFDLSASSISRLILFSLSTSGTFMTLLLISRESSCGLLLKISLPGNRVSRLRSVDIIEKH